jgi:O-antigen/teichoic acid export membrane protein
MEVAALITWLVTAAGGFVLLGTWFAKGGHRRDSGTASRFPSPLILGHFLLAALGLVLWIAYVASDRDGLTWPAFAIVAVVALLGFTMFFRWLPQVRRRGGTATTATAEAQFPVSVVVAHGVFAATTLVLVLLAAINA